MYVVGVVETWEEGEVGCVCEVGEEAEECPWCVEEFVCSSWSVGRRERSEGSLMGVRRDLMYGACMETADSERQLNKRTVRLGKVCQRRRRADKTPRFARRQHILSLSTRRTDRNERSKSNFGR